MIPHNDPDARYWSTGITLAWISRVQSPSGKPGSWWGASLDYCDDGFAGDDSADIGAISTEGTFRTSYYVTDGQERTALAAVIDTLIADAGRLGVKFVGAITDLPMLYIKGDGEDPECPPPPGWRELLKAEADRIGRATYPTRTAANHS